MLVYRSSTERLDVARELARLAAETDRTERLIGLGLLEAGVVDALFPDADGENEITCAFRRATVAAAPERLLGLPLPAEVTVGVPEGYAYYGLYPQSYAEAAERFYNEIHPAAVAVLGIRNIGTSLSAAAVSALEKRSCTVWSGTVRPRGHPFARELRLRPEFERRLHQLADRYFLIVDEGPGLSGSSMASVAEKLSQIGIPDQRIVLFPSWAPDGEVFISQAARTRWRRHRKYTGGHEHPFAHLPDLSAGAWRALLYRDEREWPAVQPQHERLKYRDGDTLWKFTGLGRYGKAKLPRAEALADAGFCPRILGFSEGFLGTEFVAGSPAAEVTPELLDLMARYLAHLRRDFPAPEAVRLDELSEMIEVNTGTPVRSLTAAACDGGATAIDGRMLPQEWLRTASGYLKVDALDHHNDHFLPGCTDIAWDVAGAEYEFGLEPGALADRYEAASGDRTIRHRLPFYRMAYVAFRLGYATLAGRAIAGTQDARRFAAVAERARSELQRATPVDIER